MPPQSRPSIVRPAFHARTSLGTTPRNVTPARDTNSPNARPCGSPTYRAIVARFTRLAYVSHGPIIQPKLVGHASTSVGRASMCRYASAAHLIGVVCVHGIAFGSFVVPEEKRTFVRAPGGRTETSKGSRSPRKSSHATSLDRSSQTDASRSLGRTTAGGPPASTTFS